VGHEHAQIKPISLDVVLNLAGPVKKRLRGKNRTGAVQNRFLPKKADAHSPKTKNLCSQKKLITKIEEE
jgi:hypothetical protein